MSENEVLTLTQAEYLAELIRGVKGNKRLKYYPIGSRDADYPMTQTLRAFTYDGGGFYPTWEGSNADIRDAFVWTSGIFERWFKVRDLVAALSNIDGHLGEDKPIAIIEE